LNQYFQVLLAAVATFAITNVDDAVLLTLLFARRVPPRRIIAGQYLGFATIVVLSLFSALAAIVIPHRWIHLLGILPLTLGIKDLFRTRQTKMLHQSTDNLGILSIALVTISSGADNVGVYVPFFFFGRRYLWLILVAYAGLIGLWCSFGRWLGNRSLILRLVDRWAEKAVPVVFIFLGIVLLCRS
jgi:cadmium resistance protein CadD (predicted permease)